MKAIGIIPARMGSSRYPGKPLAKIHGIPMIGHIVQRCRMSRLLNEVYVATCDQEIRDYCKSIGAQVIMTSPTHERASDRTAEALVKAETQLGWRADVVVMIQGDEPMVTPEMIDQSIQPILDDAAVRVVNLMAPLNDRDEQEDPNEVKVVTDLKGNALYFSREAIPSPRKSEGKSPVMKQVCIIPFRRDFLIQFNELKPTPLEIAESVDMLRVLEHGFQVKMIRTNALTYSVDTEEDRLTVEAEMKNDLLMAQYAEKLLSI